MLYFKERNVNKGNPTYQCWNYEFNFESITDDECKSEFRFQKNDMPSICHFVWTVCLPPITDMLYSQSNL